MVILAGTFKYLNGLYLWALRYLRAFKYLNGPLGGTRKWAPPPREGRGPT